MAVEVETVAENQTMDIAEVAEPVKTDMEVIAEEEGKEKMVEEKDDETMKEEIIEEKKIVKEKKKATVHKKDFEKDVVYLFQLNRCSQIPSISPLCLQVESWLKLQGIKFENVDLKTKLWSKEGKMLPFVELNGEKIIEANIFETLSRQFEKEIDSFLDEDQKKVKEELSELVESHLYWSIIHWRSVDHENLLKGYKMAVPTALGAPLPPPAVKVYFNFTYCKKGLKMVKTSKVGTNTAQEIEMFGKDVLKKLSEKLGEQKFLFGDEVSSLDLAVFSHVAQVAMVDKEQPCALREFLENECNNLLELIERVKEKVWGEDWGKATGEKLHMNPHLVVEDEKDQDVGIKRNRGGTLSRIRGALLKKKKHGVQSKKTEEDSEDKVEKETTEDEGTTEVEKSEDMKESKEETFTEAKKVATDIVNEIADVKNTENKQTCEESPEARNVEEETFPEAKEIVTDILNEVAKAKDCTKESEEL